MICNIIIYYKKLNKILNKITYLIKLLLEKKRIKRNILWLRDLTFYLLSIIIEININLLIQLYIKNVDEKFIFLRNLYLPFYINVAHLFASEECIVFQDDVVCIPYDYSQFIALGLSR